MTNGDSILKDSALMIETLIKKIEAEWNSICQKYDEDEPFLRRLHWNLNFYELNEFVDIRKMQENNFTQIIIIPSAILQACSLIGNRNDCYCNNKQELVLC